jgi:hypothetical protein
MCCGQRRKELQNKQAQRTARNVPRFVSGNSLVQDVRAPTPAPQALLTPPPLPPANSQTRTIEPEAVTTSVPRSLLRVRYLENSPIRVRGLVSGASYEFSGAHPVQHVDLRDAPSLLNTRFFRRA